MPRTKKTPKTEWLTREELPPEVIVRIDHAGEWVAWDRDMKRAVATGQDREAVRAAAIAAGVDRPICEWVPPMPIYPDDYFE
jgi:hypothetical protein